MKGFRPQKIAIVGAGAIGAYYGCLLARVGHEVHFLLRGDFEAVSREGFHVRTRETQFHLHPVHAHADVEDIGFCDLVIVALKTSDNAALAQLLPPLEAPGHTIFLTLQNGMGNVETLARLFPLGQIVAGLCFTCINRTAPGVIENYHAGRIQFADATGGPARAHTHAVAEMFAAAGVASKAVDSLERALWLKLCWNIPFNGLAIAGGGITTDRILASAPLRDLARALMLEVQEAAAAHGVEIPNNYVASQFSLTEGMGAYKPSSLIDFVAGRPVEVSAIWGEPLRRGQAKGVEMGRLACLHSLLRHMVTSR